MKVATIIYHSNIDKIYKKRWTNKCIDSILNQTYKDFDFYELNYNADNISVLKEAHNNKKKFWSEKKKNYADAMNFLLSKAYEDGYDAVFNINLDDFYDSTRFEKQLELIKQGYDLISSDFCYIRENVNDNDDIFLHMNICKYGSIESNLEKNNNVIAHPCVCYSRKFIANNRYDENHVPTEDLKLWKETYKKYKFFIIDEELLYYRIHEKQSSNR